MEVTEYDESKKMVLRTSDMIDGEEHVTIFFDPTVKTIFQTRGRGRVPSMMFFVEQREQVCEDPEEIILPDITLRSLVRLDDLSAELQLQIRDELGLTEEVVE